MSTNSKKSNMNISQIGNGFVGSALHRSFKEKGVETMIYDKFQKIGKIEDILDSEIVFLCLPTPYVDDFGFDLSAIHENLKKLNKFNYKGLCVIKSTVEPGMTKELSKEYSLNIAHNPEFLTERTAFKDFHNQKHVVLGKVKDSSLFDFLILFYKRLYPDAMISICTSDESEAMKLFSNSFYAQKVMIFNELYMLCKSVGLDFERVKDLMLKNGWIAPHHVSVPGPDGRMAYGGACFPKDTSALKTFMKNNDTSSAILEAVISERNKTRDD